MRNECMHPHLLQDLSTIFNKDNISVVVEHLCSNFLYSRLTSFSFYINISFDETKCYKNSIKVLLVVYVSCVLPVLYVRTVFRLINNVLPVTFPEVMLYFVIQCSGKLAKR